MDLILEKSQRGMTTIQIRVHILRQIRAFTRILSPISDFALGQHNLLIALSSETFSLNNRIISSSLRWL